MATEEKNFKVTVDFTQPKQELNQLISKLRELNTIMGNEVSRNANKMASESSISFTRLASSMGLAVTGYAAIAMAAQKVVEWGKKSLELSMQEDSFRTKLNFSVGQNNLMFKEQLELRDQLNKNPLFTKDQINNAISFTNEMGRTTSQSKAMIETAMGISRVTGVDINTALLQLNGTLEGTRGRFNRLSSEFKKLTTDQLIAGKGLDVLHEKFAKFRDVGGELELATSNLSKSWNELLESIGKSHGVFTGVLNWMTDLVNGVDPFIGKIIRDAEELAKLPQLIHDQDVQFKANSKEFLDTLKTNQEFQKKYYEFTLTKEYQRAKTVEQTTKLQIEFYGKWRTETEKIEQQKEDAQTARDAKNKKAQEERIKKEQEYHDLVLKLRKETVGKTAEQNKEYIGTELTKNKTAIEQETDPDKLKKLYEERNLIVETENDILIQDEQNMYGVYYSQLEQDRKDNLEKYKDDKNKQEEINKYYVQLEKTAENTANEKVKEIQADTLRKKVEDNKELQVKTTNYTIEEGKRLRAGLENTYYVSTEVIKNYFGKYVSELRKKTDIANKGGYQSQMEFIGNLGGVEELEKSFQTINKVLHQLRVKSGELVDKYYEDRKKLVENLHKLENDKAAPEAIKLTKEEIAKLDKSIKDLDADYLKLKTDTKELFITTLKESFKNLNPESYLSQLSNDFADTVADVSNNLRFMAQNMTDIIGDVKKLAYDAAKTIEVQVFQNLSTILQRNLQETLDSIDRMYTKEQTNLDKLQKNKYISDAEYQRRKDKLDKDKEDKQIAARKEAAKREKKYMEEQALISAFLGAALALASPANMAGGTAEALIMAAIQLAAGLADYAIIAAKPLTYKTGGIVPKEYALGGFTSPFGDPGGIPAILHPNEGIINSTAMSMAGMSQFVNNVNTGNSVQTVTVLHQDSINQIIKGINDKRVYVSQYDINKVNNRVNVIQKQSIL